MTTLVINHPFMLVSTCLFWVSALFAITLMFILRRTAEEEPEVEYYKDKAETLRNEKITREAMARDEMRDYTPDTNEEMHKYMNATPEEPSEIESHFLTHLDELNEQTNF